MDHFQNIHGLIQEPPSAVRLDSAASFSLCSSDAMTAVRWTVGTTRKPSSKTSEGDSNSEKTQRKVPSA